MYLLYICDCVGDTCIYSRGRPVYHAGPVRRCPERVTYPAPPAAPERAPGTADHVLRHNAAGPDTEPVQQGRGHHRQRTASGDPSLERLLLRGIDRLFYCKKNQVVLESFLGERCRDLLRELDLDDLVEGLSNVFVFKSVSERTLTGISSFHTVYLVQI